MKGRVRELAADLKAATQKLDDKAVIDFLIDQLAYLSDRIDGVEAEMAAVTHFERQRDVIVDRYATSPLLTLPDNVVLMANEFVDVSDGMYSLEYGEDGTAYRWTRGSPPARLSIWIDRSRPIRVKLTVVSMGRVGKGDSLKLDVDGKLYEFDVTDQKNVLDAGPLPVLKTHGPTDLLLVVPSVFDPSNEGSADKRSLGIALSRFEAYVDLEASVEAEIVAPAPAKAARSRGKAS